MTTARYRIRRHDERNLKIEEYRMVDREKSGPTMEWVWIGYYPKVEDTIPTLINLLLELPNADLAQQVKALGEQLQQVKSEIIEIVREAK